MSVIIYSKNTSLHVELLIHYIHIYPTIVLLSGDEYSHRYRFGSRFAVRKQFVLWLQGKFVNSLLVLILDGSSDKDAHMWSELDI